MTCSIEMINLNSVLQSNQKSPFETKLFRNNPSVCVNVLPWQPANLAARGTWGSEAGADEALTAGFHLTIGAGSVRICGPTHSTYVKGGVRPKQLDLWHYGQVVSLTQWSLVVALPWEVPWKSSQMACRSAAILVALVMVDIHFSRVNCPPSSPRGPFIHRASGSSST